MFIKAAASGLEKIFREGLEYKKAGVQVLNLSPENLTFPSLFQDQPFEDNPKRKDLLKTIDVINRSYGKGTLLFGSEGLHKTWSPKATFKSPAYTQRWDQLMKVGE